MRTRIFFLITTIVCPLLIAETKKAFEIRDLYDLKSISGLALSPDGSRLAFSVTSFELEAGKENAEIFLLDISSGELRQLTRDTAADIHPIWSPEGDHLFFLSARSGGATQLWRLPLRGGEAEELTRFPTGASEPLVSPDARSAFFTSRVFPECGADAECNRKMSEGITNGPVQAHLADELLFRHWDTYRGFRYSQLFQLDLDSGEIRQLTPGDRDYPTYGGELALSPAGDRIAITLNTDRDTAISTNSDIGLIRLAHPEEEVRILTASNPAFDGNPRFSPDGRYLAYRLQRIPSYESDRFRLAVIDLSTGDVRTLTESIDNWVERIAWHPDSTGIYFTVQEEGGLPIYTVDLETGGIRRLINLQSIQEMVVSPDGRHIYLTRTSVGEPVEIFELDTSRLSLRQLTRINQPVVEKVDIRPAETLWVEGDDGIRIQVFVVKPHGFDPSKKYPLILNVHGGPQYQWLDSFRADWQVYPGAGYVVAFPNPHGSTGYGQSFTEAISGDYAGKVMEDIERVADALSGLPYVDSERMGAMGWSWGGYAMMWLEGNSTRFKALAAMMGIFDLASMYLSTEELWFVNWDNRGAPWENPDYYDVASPSSYAPRFKTPCLVITGERDYRVPYTQSIQFFTALQRMGVPSRLIIFKNDGHWPNLVRSMPVYYNAHLEWFHRFLGGGKAPFDTEKLVRNTQFAETDSGDRDHAK